MRSLVILPAIVSGAVGCAPTVEAPPAAADATDVFLVELVNQGGLLGAGRPVRVTDREDYDNQPEFLDGGRTLVYSARHGNQTDILGVDVGGGGEQRLTLTLESEYSPKATPGAEGFSAVRVEQDGRQRLWAFDRAEGALPRLLAIEPDYVGYYAWFDPATIAAHVLGDPAELHLVDLTSGTHRRVWGDPGRSIAGVPGQRAVSFIAVNSAGERWLHVLDGASAEVRPLIPALPDSLDHAWTPDGLVLMSRGSIVHARDPSEPDGDWFVFADFTRDGLAAISRLTVSPAGDRLALVAAHETPGS